MTKPIRKIDQPRMLEIGSLRCSELKALKDPRNRR